MNMPQLRFDLEDETFWPGTVILLSLAPKYYQQLQLGLKKYEYRRGGFVEKPVTAFVYATAPKDKADRGLPCSQIGLVIKLGVPTAGLEAVVSIKKSEDGESESVMRNWLRGFSTASAHPVEHVYRFPRPLTLAEIRAEFPAFHPPQRYLVLQKESPIRLFLERKSGAFEK